MKRQWIMLTGRLMKGHRVASGPSSAYPYSTIEKQKPFFKELGLDLDPFYNGTLNISIAPRMFEMSRPEFTFENVAWTDLHPPETFSFSRCRVRFEGREHDGWVYYPHPETKKKHFQDPSLIEVIAYKIPNIKYGDAVELELNNAEITLSKP